MSSYVTFVKCLSPLLDSEIFPLILEVGGSVRDQVTFIIVQSAFSKCFSSLKFIAARSQIFTDRKKVEHSIEKRDYVGENWQK